MSRFCSAINGFCNNLWYGCSGETEKGYCHYSGLYKSRYYANKHKRGNEVVIKVEGGYTIATVEGYKIWKNQK